MKINIRIQSLLVLATILFFSPLAFGQDSPIKPKSDFWEKVRFGGGFGVNFGNTLTNINISPSALYQPNEYIAFGPGLNYTYQKFSDTRTSIIGASAIVISNPLDFLQLSGELEQLRATKSFDGAPNEEPISNTALFLGAGYRLNIGGNSLGAVGIRYNVLFKEIDKIYQDAWLPFVRVYF